MSDTNGDRPCPHCGAQPKQPCRRPNGDKFTGYYGEPKFHAKRQSRAETAVKAVR